MYFHLEALATGEIMRETGIEKGIVTPLTGQSVHLLVDAGQGQGPDLLVVQLHLCLWRRKRGRGRAYQCPGQIMYQVR